MTFLFDDLSKNLSTANLLSAIVNDMSAIHQKIQTEKFSRRSDKNCTIILLSKSSKYFFEIGDFRSSKKCFSKSPLEDGKCSISVFISKRNVVPSGNKPSLSPDC